MITHSGTEFFWLPVSLYPGLFSGKCSHLWDLEREGWGMGRIPLMSDVGNIQQNKVCICWGCGPPFLHFSWMTLGQGCLGMTRVQPCSRHLAHSTGSGQPGSQLDQGGASGDAIHGQGLEARRSDRCQEQREWAKNSDPSEVQRAAGKSSTGLRQDRNITLCKQHVDTHKDKSSKKQCSGWCERARFPRLSLWLLPLQFANCSTSSVL